MQFLIPTEPDDLHAIVVKLALEEMGHDVTLLFTADYPTQQKNSVYINSNEYRWQSKDQHEAILMNKFDVVWWRRARKPYLPKNIIHPDDYEFFIRENSLFYESFTHSIAADAWWANTKEAANRANFKLLQLKLARESGMTIPDTLCSNDAVEIRKFMLKHKQSSVIYKPMCSHTWFEEDQMKIIYTSKLCVEKLPSSKTLQLSTGIYQKEIKKKYELRITCFGDYLVGLKLDSQAHPEGQLDWRKIPCLEMSVEPYSIPLKLTRQIQHFMRQLGIVFGAFDFIVTPDDEYVFLEVNEQGQFLWFENCNPELKMLDIFTQFLVGRTSKFSWKPGQTHHTMERYQPYVEAIFNKNMKNHVNLNHHKGKL